MIIKQLLKKITLITLISAPNLLYAQLGINSDNSAPSTNAMLDVSSPSKGILIPRSGADLASPTDGLLYYNNTSHNFRYYDGSTWQQAFFGTQWNINGLNYYYNGGNIGIGNPTPAFKLDILHAGGTAALFKSSAGLSNITIDGLSGEAGITLSKAGVNQWYLRNRPTDNNFEIFESAGGSRMVIRKNFGYVGIGESTPAYKLDVLHSGETGLRVRSSGTYSLIDIDAANGEGALRFLQSGIILWNTRNNPSTDDYQIYEFGIGERLRIENTTGKVVISQNAQVVGTLSKGAGSFKIDHPLDPENKYLSHSFVESPDMMNIYNGNIITDASGKATVNLPAYFEALNMDFRYQLTIIGSYAQAMISKKVSNNQFEISTNQPNTEVSWQITGIRHDEFANKNRIPNEENKPAVEKGKYLHPNAFNKDKTKSINYEKSLGGSSIDN